MTPLHTVGQIHLAAAMGSLAHLAIGHLTTTEGPVKPLWLQAPPTILPITPQGSCPAPNAINKKWCQVNVPGVTYQRQPAVLSCHAHQTLRAYCWCQDWVLS